MNPIRARNRSLAIREHLVVILGGFNGLMTSKELTEKVNERMDKRTTQPVVERNLAKLWRDGIIADMGFQFRYEKRPMLIYK